ncbi:MAG: hypothetical protein EOM23_05005, partial [Candidatus Moranbacteria bacterium]|nr:hypothetical protein [Candidatus Moranbacteria bacterium]
MHAGKISAALKLLIVAILLMLQILIMFFSVYFLRQYFAFIYTMLEFACMVTIIALINKNDDQVYKFSWAMIVAIFSVSGLLMYFMWGRSNKSKKIKKRMENAYKRLKAFTRKDEHRIKKLEEKFPLYKRFSAYLKKEGFSLYSNTRATYFSLGEDSFEALFNDLE